MQRVCAAFFFFLPLIHHCHNHFETSSLTKETIGGGGIVDTAFHILHHSIRLDNPGANGAEVLEFVVRGLKGDVFIFFT